MFGKRSSTGRLVLSATDWAGVVLIWTRRVIMMAEKQRNTPNRMAKNEKAQRCSSRFTWNIHAERRDSAVRLGI